MGKIGARPEKERRTFGSLATERSLNDGVSGEEEGDEKWTRAAVTGGRDERREAMLHGDMEATGEEEAVAAAIAIFWEKIERDRRTETLAFRFG